MLTTSDVLDQSNSAVLYSHVYTSAVTPVVLTIIAAVVCYDLTNFLTYALLYPL